VDFATPRGSRVDRGSVRPCGDNPPAEGGQGDVRASNIDAITPAMPDDRRVSCKSCSLNDQKTLGTRSNSW